MKKSIVVIGIGEMSGVFTRSLLRAGYPIIPITREMDINKIAQQVTDPQMVLIAVGEKELPSVLIQLPDTWKNKVTLLQNELLPRDWQIHQLEQPTIISVWFEKKKGQDFKIVVPSPIFGPQADIIQTALAYLEIPTFIVNNNEDLLFELVRKNIYILTTNIAGLEIGGNVNFLWNENRQLALNVISDILIIQNHLSKQEHDQEQLIESVVKAIHGDLTHQCMGRSAPDRLSRALTYAKQHNLVVTELHRIHQTINTSPSKTNG
jgi:hypothetical protein